MNGLREIYTELCEHLSNIGVRCSLRGSVESGSDDEYSDLDVAVYGFTLNRDLVERILAEVERVAGRPAKIRFDSDETENVMFSVHSLRRPIFQRIDICIDGNLDDDDRLYFSRKYPWYDHWHYLMKEMYQIKWKLRNTNRA